MLSWNSAFPGRVGIYCLLDGFCDYAQNDGFGWYNEVGRYSRPPRHFIPAKAGIHLWRKSYLIAVSLNLIIDRLSFLPGRPLLVGVMSDSAFIRVATNSRLIMLSGDSS